MPGRVWRAIVQWLAQFWADLKASTDAGLLSVLRFLGLLYGPIDAKSTGWYLVAFRQVLVTLLRL